MNVSPPILGARPQPDGATRFRVWAPNADRLTVLLVESGRRVSMARDEAGYHTAEVNASPGALYFYEFDDGRRRPDPASLAQPTAEGVHGPSMVVTSAPSAPCTFHMPPIEHHVFYELHVGTFTPEGTLDAVIRRLRDLKRLGVTAVELMPIAAFPGDRNWGYDGVCPFAVHTAYGGIDALHRLVQACHEHDLAIALDVVYNHLGPEGNYLRDFGPYFSDRHATAWGESINFDGPGSDHVREFFIQNALHWVAGCGIDALRLDAVHAIVDHTARTFIQELGERVHRTAERAGRRVLLIAESSANDPRLVRPPERGGAGLDGCWNDDFHHAIRSAITGETRGYYKPFGKVEQIAKCVEDRFVFAGEYSSGYNRRHGAPARDVPHARFVVCTQNHDQVGNRPFGDRLDESAGADGARVAAALVLLSPFTPLLWMGEEYAEPAPFQYFVSHTEPALIEAVRAGRKAEFADLHEGTDPPDPQDVETFARSKVDWVKRAEGVHAKRLAYYTELLRLRRELDLPALSDRVRAFAWGACRCVAVVYPGAIVVANLGAASAEIDVGAVGPPRAAWAKLIDSGDLRWGGSGAVFEKPNDAARLAAPARTAALWRTMEEPS